MKLKKQKFKSKKGVTLVELLVGIAIIVIVFASTLGAMATGYTTTVYNADQNKVSAKNASVNEVIMKAVQVKGWSAAPAGVSFDDDSTIPNSIKQTALSECSDIKYVKPADFPNNTDSNQYTIIIDSASEVSKTGASKITIKGITIKTAMKGADGLNIYESFVPYV